jgi:hypothetical protein
MGVGDGSHKGGSAEMRWQKRHLLHGVAATMLLGVATGYLCRPSNAMASPQNTVPAKPVAAPKVPSAPVSQPLAMPAPEKPSVTPADLQRALSRIDNATFLLMVVTTVVGGLGLVLALASIGAVMISRSVIRGWVRERARETANVEINRFAARVWSGMGFIEWARVRGKSKGLALAIELEDRALAAAMQAEDVERVAIIKSNLAYFYAEEALSNKKEIALEYARQGSDSFLKYPGTTQFLPNSVYVRMRYADASDESTLRSLKAEAEDLVRRFPKHEDELRDYIREMEEKCPALARGANGTSENA